MKYWYVLHPKIPRFGRDFSESYRIFPTATEFSRQLQNLTDSYRILQTATDFSRRKTTDSYVPTSEPLRLVYVHPLPFPRPHDPVPPSPDPAPPFCPAGPVELSLPPPAICTKRPNFTDRANCSDSYQIFPREIPNFAYIYQNCRQRYRILPTEIPNVADSYRISPT